MFALRGWVRVEAEPEGASSDVQTGEQTRSADDRDRANGRVFLLLLAMTVTISLAAVQVFEGPAARVSLLVMVNLVGPTVASLLQGHGMTACTEAMGTLGNPICFHAARMPVPSLVVASGIELLGNHYLRVGYFKTLLFLLPIEAAIFVVCRRLAPRGWRRWVGAGLLLLPFFLLTFLADVVNMQVEEGYSYSLLALALALVLFPAMASGPGWRRVLLFATAASGLYLAKSSMAPAVAVLTMAFVWPLRRERRMALTALCLVLLAPVGWAMWQHHAAGRYTLGTSIDGVNLHKGNDEIFLAHYPPTASETLDSFDPGLNRGRHFDEEWSFNDYHQRAAVAYIRTHPGETARADWRKLSVVLFSMRKLGSRPLGGVLEMVETAGLVVFRLLLWGALGISGWWVLRGGQPWRRYAGAVFLLLIAAVALPYVVGFAYTRHVSVLIYPAALMLCRALAEPVQTQRQP